MTSRYKAPPPQFRAALRRARSMPLSRWLQHRSGGYAADRHRSGAMIPADMDFGVTADHIVYEEREPRITPTGILDHRGMMLVRITVPIKEEIGFARDLEIERQPDEVETILPEDMLAISDCGLGVGYVRPHEVEGDDASPEMIERIVRAAIAKCDGDPDAAKAMLAEMGIDVEFDTVDAEDAGA